MQQSIQIFLAKIYFCGSAITWQNFLPPLKHRFHAGGSPISGVLDTFKGYTNKSLRTQNPCKNDLLRQLPNYLWKQPFPSATKDGYIAPNFDRTWLNCEPNKDRSDEV